jgi:small subunit ribosomal protein S2
MITLDDMVQMGLHYGHQTHKWNPKMAPHIFTKRNGIHIIDLLQTYSYLKKVCFEMMDRSYRGETFLFVGTKKQVSPLIAQAAFECHSFYVNHRWLGGMLTNWETLKKSLEKYEELDTKERFGAFNRLPKKEASICKKKLDRLEMYLYGIREMKSLPDVVIIIGQPEEMNAVLECRKLGITTITVVDTDCDPSLTDFFVPANDDSVTALRFVLGTFVDAILTGREKFQLEVDSKKKQL